MVKVSHYIIFIFLLSCIPQISNKLDSEGYNIEREYYTNGVLQYETSYRYGKLEGFSKSWSVGGNLVSKVHYKNGYIHGIWETYYDSGEIKNTTYYVRGKKHGKETWYHRNGIKQSEIYYINDKIDSKILRWDETGKQIIN